MTDQPSAPDSLSDLLFAQELMQRAVRKMDWRHLRDFTLRLVEFCDGASFLVDHVSLRNVAKLESLFGFSINYDQLEIQGYSEESYLDHYTQCVDTFGVYSENRVRFVCRDEKQWHLLPAHPNDWTYYDFIGCTQDVFEAFFLDYIVQIYSLGVLTLAPDRVLHVPKKSQEG